MPPKKKEPAKSKKTEQKQKERIIEDKTFGLKNKKGTKQQKYVQQVEKQVKTGGQTKVAKLKESEQDIRKKEKEDKKKAQDELNALFKPVQAKQQVGKGVDPKSVVCAFFKQGTCRKGDKCKFSHDLTVERRGEKRSMYFDTREENEAVADTMEDWDDDKLADVINKKHGEKEKTKPKTEIVCKFFLTAIEDFKYGWFWECPNGNTCHYRHALPDGFILKRDKKKMEEQMEHVSLEELIESERSKLGVDTTKVTLETFLAWKRKKQKEKLDLREEERTKKAADFRAGRMLGLSGKDMFTFNPDMAEDDDEEGVASDIYKQRERVNEDGDEDEVEAREIDVAEFSDLSALSGPAAKTQQINDKHKEEAGKLSMAAGGGHLPINNGSVEIDENLFLEGDVPIDEGLFMEDEEDLDLALVEHLQNDLQVNDEPQGQGPQGSKLWHKIS